MPNEYGTRQRRRAASGGKGRAKIVHTENFDHFVGEISEDPSAADDPGARIHLGRRVFVPNEPPGGLVRDVPNMAHYDGVLLSVHFIADGHNELHGSAVMVAPGIALMASHVFEKFVPDLAPPEGSSMMCIGYTSSGMKPWYVRSFNKVPKSDVTVLALQYASPLRDGDQFAQALITTRLPRLGERVMIVGMQASNQHIPWTSKGSFPIKDKRIEFGADIKYAVGEVIGHQVEGRGPSRQPGQSFDVDCWTPGSFSGGPAFGEDGRLVGILSSCLNPSGPSCVSLLRTAMAVEIEPYFLSHLFPKKLRLVDTEQCDIEGRTELKVTVADEIGLVRVEIDDKKALRAPAIPRRP